MEVVGLRVVDYNSKKTGERITGIDIHCLNPENLEDQSVIGRTSEKVFVSSRVPCFPDVKDIKVGDEIKVFYNKYGGVDDILLVTHKK